MRTLTVAGTISLMLASALARAGDDLKPGIAHGGAVVHAGGDCITPVERDLAAAAISDYLAAHPAYGGRTRPLFPFIPLGGTLFGDVLPPGYVDHDPTSGFQDYSCHGFTYDGHKGADFGLHSFSEQAIGVPVFAALDGTVVYYHDGEPDMSTCTCGGLANALIIDHGNGLFGWYWHMRNGSVVPRVNDHVTKGEQLGLAASSGNSAGPHLHFESTATNDETQVLDPFVGDCNAGASGWADQPPLNLSTYIADFGFSTQNLSGLPYYPYRLPNTGQMGFDQFLWFWAQVVNLPPHSTWRQKYIRPDSSIAFDSGDVSFDSNQTDFYRVSNWWWYSYYVPDMRAIAGTWHVELDINGVQAISAPLEVVPTADPNFNRPPVSVTLSFEPAQPSPSDAVFCRVNGSQVLDDPDYDLVRFTYTWRRNGQIIRQVVSAGRADAIAANSLSAGDTVTCTVTPNDGHVDGPSAMLAATLPGGCGSADFNCDGDLGTDADIESFFACLSGVCPPAPCASTADFNNDGDVGTDSDIASFFSVLAGGSC